MKEAARRKPGRPPAAESQNRLAEIIHAAKGRFALHGYDGTSLSAVAADAGISLAALYHHVEGKPELYELVFKETLTTTWQRIREHMQAAAPAPTFTAQLTALADAARTTTGDDRFLTTVNIEVLRHPELRELIHERDAVRDPIFASIVKTALGDANLSAADLDAHIMMARLVIMGWATESAFHTELRSEFDAALEHLGTVLDDAVQDRRLTAVEAASKNGAPAPRRKTKSARPGPRQTR
jgi:AcrR family transcriptional regulator